MIVSPQAALLSAFWKLVPLTRGLVPVVTVTVAACARTKPTPENVSRESKLNTRILPCMMFGSFQLFRLSVLCFALDGRARCPDSEVTPLQAASPVPQHRRLKVLGEVAVSR